MNCPLERIAQWLNEEVASGNTFSQGAVLSTVAKNGRPRSRVVGTMLDASNVPKFHTSPYSRKFGDIEFCGDVSLTYSFNNSLRSISIEGQVSPLQGDELDVDWLKYDEIFRRNYLVFGKNSGTEINSLVDLESERDILNNGAEAFRPESFVGFKFTSIDRVSFYSVKENDFSVNDLYEKDAQSSRWQHSLLTP
ncbi:MAG: pyridoxamine 5'-phosphate oxidase family protein [Bermanella sp.]